MFKVGHYYFFLMMRNCCAVHQEYMSCLPQSRKEDGTIITELQDTSVFQRPSR